MEVAVVVGVRNPAGSPTADNQRNKWVDFLFGFSAIRSPD